MDRPVLLCGLGRVGWRILDHLRAAGVAVTVVDLKAEANDPRLAGARFVPGDCRKPEVLEKAGVAGVGAALVVMSDDLVNVTTALLIRQLNPQARIVLRMFNQNLIPRLGGAVSNMTALSVSALTAPLMALTAVTGHAVTSVRLNGGAKQIAEIPIEPDSKLIGHTIADAAATEHLKVLAHTSAGREALLWHGLNAQAKLNAGDSLLVCGEPATIAPLLSVSRDELPGGVRWAGWIRRQYRTLRHTLATADRPVQIALAVLLVVLVGNALMFRFALGTNWIDAIYNSVTVFVANGDFEGVTLTPAAKAYLSVMKLASLGLIAVFIAIFTQYLIRARLGGALEARHIPDGGHIVVCGLGNIGFRCVEELVRLKHSVVALDNVADNAFAATVRRMGIPVVIGDATVATVLQQVRAAEAGAVIACTDSELTNLEVALLVREMNAKQRVVVRLSEHDFARAVRDAANIRHAVSVPALAAPAFAAALFGDRVQSLVTVGCRTLAVMELVVNPGETGVAGRPWGDVAAEFRLLPLEDSPANRMLAVGEKLTVIVEVADMQKMTRAQTVSAS